MILTSDLVNMPIGVAAGYAVMGFAIVFFGLILLMLVATYSDIPKFFA